MKHAVIILSITNPQVYSHVNGYSLNKLQQEIFKTIIHSIEKINNNVIKKFIKKAVKPRPLGRGYKA